MDTYATVSEMIGKREKAKLAILKELANKDLDLFETTNAMREKYYGANFVTYPFLEALKEKKLIEEKEGKYRLVNGKAIREVLSANQGDLEKVFSVEYGRGDLVGQLIEQEKYILGRVLSFGNSVSVKDLYDSLFEDVDSRQGQFFGYAKANYGKKKAQEVTKNLAGKGFLKINGSVSVPERILVDYVTENMDGLLLELKQLSEKNKQLVEKNQSLHSKVEQFDPSISLEKLNIPLEVKGYITKAIARINEKSYSEAIIDCYRVSETLVKILFPYLYPEDKNEQVKHEDKLKRIWNEERKEKHDNPGIKVIASLLSVVLWYRNKMAAHTEMKPTEEAARITVFSLIQSLVEFNRLGIKIE